MGDKKKKEAPPIKRKPLKSMNNIIVFPIKRKLLLNNNPNQKNITPDTNIRLLMYGNINNNQRNMQE